MIRKPIQYVSSSPGNSTGIVRATKFYKGQRYSKTFSWHCRERGRTEEDALCLAYEYLDVQNDVLYCQNCRIVILDESYDDKYRICQECINEGYI